MESTFTAHSSDQDAQEKSSSTSGSSLKYPRFVVRASQITTDSGEPSSLACIAMQDQFGLITELTELHHFAGSRGRKTVSSLVSDHRKQLHYACAMLNWILIDHPDLTGVTSIGDITKESMEMYFCAYAQEPKASGILRIDETVKDCIDSCTAFMYDYALHMPSAIDPNSLYRIEPVQEPFGRRASRGCTPDFSVCRSGQTHTTLRDMPTQVLNIMLPLAFQYVPRIAFGIAAGVSSGIRAGETLNLCQQISPLGGNLTFTEADGSVREIQIDLLKNKTLRGDGIKTGYIKVPRVQKVFPKMIPLFMTAYEAHQNYLSHVRFDPCYAPMFPNARGDAMTYESYRYYFKKLVNKYLIPALINSPDPGLRIYGQLLMERPVCCHITRHLFTVILVLEGLELADIQTMRGDATPETAIEYLKNKGDLIQVCRDTEGQLTDMLLSLARKLMKLEGMEEAEEAEHLF